MPNDKTNATQGDALSEFMLEKVSGGQKKYDSSNDNREPDKLYYREKVIDQNRTPAELTVKYPELGGFLLQMTLFGYDDRPLSDLINGYSLAAVQNLIDSYSV